jgi:hypothetical protein
MMGRIQSRAPAWLLGVCLAFGLLLGGCAGDQRLAQSATT